MEQGDYDQCPEAPKPFVTVLKDGFGIITNENGNVDIVKRYTFTNQNYLTVQVISYGATVTSIKYPDKNGILDDIVLGFDNLEGYLSPLNPYFGATIGRCANRIAKGHFKIGCDDYQLSQNLDEHHLHGGFKGFDKANWKSDIQDNKVVMTYLSMDGEEGYPGEVLASVSYELTTDNELIIEMKATSSKPTPINLTNHTYFNLGGHAKGASSLYQHVVAINADKVCHTDENFIPSGMLKNVVNTVWDLRIGRRLGSVLPHVPYGGYDQNMCIHKTSSECMTFVARVLHPKSGRTLEVYSNQPGVQFYTGNQLPSKSLHTELDGMSLTTSAAIQKIPYPSTSYLNTPRQRQGHKRKARRSLLQAPGFLSGDSELPRRHKSESEVGADGCRVRKCPVCGQLIKDPDFENISEEKACIEDNESGQITGNERTKLIGKGGLEYFRHAGFCLMTQKFPDSVHRKNFPNCILKPGDNYYHIVKYKFGIQEEIELEPEEDLMVVVDEIEGEVAEEEVTKEEDDLLSTKLEENGR